MPSVADASWAKLLGLGHNKGTLKDRQISYLRTKTGNDPKKTYADMYKELYGSPVKYVIPESKIT